MVKRNLVLLFGLTKKLIIDGTILPVWSFGYFSLYKREVLVIQGGARE